MSMGTLTMVAESVNGKLIGDDRAFESVSTDTRTLAPGQLFFALQGENFDATAFIEEAGRRGAAGAVVARRQPSELPQVEVPDTLEALGLFAKDWRARFAIPVIAVTGSNGKTTVKEMVASILLAELGDQNALVVTQGNLNNEIGLPLTILRLRDLHRMAVLEMGASHPGDIAYLAGIAAPGTGIVTNAGAAHLEGFGTREAVAATKGELFEGLPADGVAIINRDDAFFETWLQLSGSKNVRTFGLSPEADYSARDIRETTADGDCELEFAIESRDGALDIRLPMAGRHNVLNALAAVAATRAVGVSVEAVQRGLAAMGNMPGRLRAVPGAGGATIYDDSYNANPVSVRAAIEFLAGRGGKTWLVLGDMAELGPDSAELHRETGAAAKASGVSRLFCVGPESRAAAEAFGDGGQWFESLDVLAKAMTSTGRNNVTILIKGSRCMGLEKLVDILRDADPDRQEG
jgi:UDP-N-acetylmuramoyl-tripeptide--D-alanyl-D-alanine ligase